MSKKSPLLETHELAALNLNDICIIETDMTRDAFDTGHIPGTVFWSLDRLFTPQFQLKTEAESFASLLESSGITPDTLVICSFNGSPEMVGWAPWLYWILTSFGHERTVVLNGGTLKWRAEGRPLTAIESQRVASHYFARSPFDEEQRAVLPQVQEAVSNGSAKIIDARSEEEYEGRYFFNGPPKEGERAGRIPGALHLPHTTFINPDGTFRCPNELLAVTSNLELDPETPCIPYCAVGIRSSLVWFALKELLGFADVRNYDGSWNQWSRVQSD